MSTSPDRQPKACTLDFDEGRVSGVMRDYQDAQGKPFAHVLILRALFPEAGIPRYFKSADDIALNVSVPLPDSRLTILDSHPKAAIAIRYAVSSAFFKHIYVWEMTKAGLRRLIENIEGLTFGVRSEAVHLLLAERRHTFFTLEDMPIHILPGDDDRIVLASVTPIVITPDWSVQIDGEVKL